MRSKGKISGVFSSKTFKPDKCKTSLKLAAARIKLLKNRREIQVRQLRREVAQLLEAGQDQTARIRVEHVIREEKTMAAYDLIEVYCELIAARLQIIESQKNCPVDLKEAVASVIFSSPRCADLPELMDVQKHFSAKYSKEFISAALELRPDCGVSTLIVEKLSAKAPDIQTKIKILTAIAEENNVKWEPKAFEEQMPTQGAPMAWPSTLHNSKILVAESSGFSPSLAPAKNEFTEKLSENVMTYKPTSSNLASDKTVDAPHTSVPVYSRSDSKDSGSKYERDEAGSSHFKGDKASSTRSNVKTHQFKDAASAAQAAAESAEMASIAARAAAELARRGNPPTASNESSTSGSRDGANNPLDKDIPKPSTVLPEAKRSSDQMKSDVHDLRTIQTVQEGQAKNAYAASASIDERATERSTGEPSSPTHSSSSSIDDDIPESPANLRGTNSGRHDWSVKSFSNAEFTVNKDVEFETVDSEDKKIGKPLSAGDGNIPRVAIWDDNVDDEEYEIVDSENKNSDKPFSASDATILRDNVWNDNRGDAVHDSAHAVFDDYGSDTDDHLIFESGMKGNLFDSVSQQDKEEIYGFEENRIFTSDKVFGGGYPGTNSPLSQLSVNLAEKAEAGTKENLSSHYDYNPPSFDSDGLSENEDEHEKSMDGDRSAVGPGYGVEKEVGRAYSKSPSTVSDANEKSKGAVWSSSGNYEEETVIGLWNSEPSERNSKTPAHADVNDDKEEPVLRLPSEDSLGKGRESKTKLREESSRSTSKDQEYLEDNYESDQSLGFGTLRGGFKNRGYARPPYRKKDDPAEKPVARQSKETSEDFNVIRDSFGSGRGSQDYKDSSLVSPPKDLMRDSGKRNDSAARSRNLRDNAQTLSEYSRDTSIDSEKTSGTESRESSSRMPRNYFDQKNDEADGVKPLQNVEKRGTGDVKLSRRTRDAPSKAGKGGLLGATSRSGDNSYKEEEIKPVKTKTAPTTDGRSLESDSLKFESTAQGKDQILMGNEKKSDEASSSGKSPAQQGSTRAPHVHPKLPDYDSFAAMFKARRSDQS